MCLIFAFHSGMQILGSKAVWDLHGRTVGWKLVSVQHSEGAFLSYKEHVLTFLLHFFTY